VKKHLQKAFFTKISLKLLSKGDVDFSFVRGLKITKRKLTLTIKGSLVSCLKLGKSLLAYIILVFLNGFSCYSGLVMDQGQKFFTQSIFLPGQPSLGWIWVWKISAKNLKFFSLRVKKIPLGQVKNYPCQRQVSLLFTAGQKYARVRSGPISILVTSEQRSYCEK